MDALTIPAVGGIDSTALIMGDFSNGNDGIVMKNGTTVAALKGREVKLVELSVSHYLLSRALEINGMKEKDLKIINTSDADIGSIFITDKNAAAVTWNPILMKIRQDKGATVVFDSSKIPGEIMDLLVVKTAADDKLKKALVGAWYETMNLMKTGDQKALEFMAKNSGSTVDEFKAQLVTTKMFFDAAEATAFMKSKEPAKTMDYVRTFSFSNGLFGAGAKDKDFVGISFADGTTMGNPKNIKLRFDATYMDMAAANKL
jgi:NitT/TauT family transport system substrate-binding protein